MITTHAVLFPTRVSWNRHSGMLAQCLVVLLVFAASAPLFGWSAPGHRIIAAAAAQLLTPEAQATVTDLLRGKTMTSVAAWADHIRPSHPETMTFHYINLPLEADSYDPARDDAAGPSIIPTLDRFLAALSDQSLSPAARAEALKYVIHFIGDLHQPLHCATNRDAGGNNTQVRLNGKAMNLHHLWDMEFLTFSGLNDKQYAEVLLDKTQKLTTAEREAIEKGTIPDWAMESHRLARAAYQLPANRHLDDSYLKEHQPIVEQQLVRAIVRLAFVLNRAFPKR